MSNENKFPLKKRSTGPSCVVPHRSTTPARTCLTSLFGWEAMSLGLILLYCLIYCRGRLKEALFVYGPEAERRMAFKLAVSLTIECLSGERAKFVPKAQAAQPTRAGSSYASMSVEERQRPR